MYAAQTFLVATLLAVTAAHGDNGRLAQLRNELHHFEGFYVTNEISRPPRSLRIAIDPADDYLILDTWFGGSIERLLEVNIEEMFSEREHDTPAMFYFTGLQLPTYQYGNFRRAALHYFFLFYYENGERVVSLTINEFGRTFFKIESAVDKVAGLWPQENESLAKFLAGDYELPPTNVVCENWLRRR